jgi:putative ABC transport system ATP-binding protein
MAVELNGIQFSYGEDRRKQLLDIEHWAVKRGERVLIHGPSGAGKTTLLNIVSGLLTCKNGEVSVLDQRLDLMPARQRDRFRADNIGCVFQRFNLIPYLNSIDNIGLASTFSANGHRQWRDQATSLLNGLMVDRDDWAKPTSELSMGQQQRVAIARALINSPDLLIADEPTSSLDSENRDNFLALLMKLINKRDMTLIFVSHDMALAEHFTRLDALSDITQWPRTQGPR